MEQFIVKCNSLTKSYGTKVALKNVTLNLGKGRIIGLLGPNGSGKTTFIKICTGLVKPSQGDITIDDKVIGNQTKAIVSYLPERTYFENSANVLETIKFFKDFYSDFDEQRAFDMLKSLDIDVKQKFKKMSKGTKEKVQLIMVMSRRAKLYLLDEPIAGVDPAARDYIINTIINNYDDDATVVISTHLISDIENILDDVIFIKNGEIVFDKNVDELRDEHNKSIDALFREVFRC